VNFSAHDLADSLQKGIKQLNLDATREQQTQLISLLEQLIKWNKTYNLTAIKTPKEGLTLHLLDSLAVVPFIKANSVLDVPNVLDVGTGAGFPGLPLAIMLPEVNFTLLDSNAKKTRFIRQQIHLLGLNNVEVIHSRVEQQQNISENERFAIIISRAFASLANMVSLTQHLLAENGRWLAMKGRYDADEIKDLADHAQEVAHYRLNIPSLTAERCLVELKRCLLDQRGQID